MKIIPTTVSPLYGGDGAPSSEDFNDCANDLNFNHSINKIEFDAGWVVDGMRRVLALVTYSAGDGLAREIVHGKFSASNVGGKVVTLAINEYISHVEGVHGRPNGQYDYGDCIQKIKFTIKDSQSGTERTTDYFGAAHNLSPEHAKPFSWDGHLFAFAGRADNGRPQVGLKGLAFAQASDPVLLACSAPYAGEGRPGKDYDDVADFGSKLNFKCPIKKLVVWAGDLVDGIEVTYNLADKSTKTLMHGVKGGSPNEVPLSDEEMIIEVKGLHGDSYNAAYGNQVHAINFSIYNSRTRFIRTTKTFGAATWFYQETRKDICVLGPLFGFAGCANNGAPNGKWPLRAPLIALAYHYYFLAGLNTIMCFTLVPAERAQQS